MQAVRSSDTSNNAIGFICICQRTSAMRGGDPPSGEPYLQRLVGIRMFSLLFSKTIPNRRFEPPPFSDLPTATCATNAAPNTLSGRLAARSRAAVAASGCPIFFYVSNVSGEGQNPAAGFCTFTALFGVSFCTLITTEELARFRVVSDVVIIKWPPAISKYGFC